MTRAARPENLKPPAPVVTAAEAERLGAHFLDVMDALVGMVQQETNLVRGGKLGHAAALAGRKAQLTCLYVADTLRLRANRAQIVRIAPGLFKDLRRRHDEFRALLQINLAVLAVAQTVSESMLRGTPTPRARWRSAGRCAQRWVSVGHRLCQASILLIRRITHQARAAFRVSRPSRRGYCHGSFTEH